MTQLSSHDCQFMAATTSVTSLVLNSDRYYSGNFFVSGDTRRHAWLQQRQFFTLPSSTATVLYSAIFNSDSSLLWLL